MTRRLARLLLLAVLATFALDLADADCTGAGRLVQLESPSPGCACCILSEAPAPVAVQPLLLRQRGARPPFPGQRLDGVRPVPYRPPLTLS